MLDQLVGAGEVPRVEADDGHMPVRHQIALDHVEERRLAAAPRAGERHHEAAVAGGGYLRRERARKSLPPQQVLPVLPERLVGARRDARKKRVSAGLAHLIRRCRAAYFTLRQSATPFERPWRTILPGSLPFGPWSRTCV